MSAWGPGPFQSDETLDWLGEIRDNVEAVINDALVRIRALPKGPCPECSLAVAAVDLCLRVNELPMGKPELLDQGAEILEYMLDVNEPDLWKSSEERRIILKDLLERVNSHEDRKDRVQ